MKKHVKNTKTRIIQNLVILLVAGLIAFGSTLWIWNASVYTVRHMAVVNAEREGNTPTYTANGEQTWLPGEVEAYNNAKEAREEIVSKSDVAKFLFDCGGSITGKIVRAIVCIGVIIQEIIAIMYAISSAKSIFRGTRRLIRWKIKEYKEKKAELNSSKKKDSSVQCTTECA